MAEKFLMSTRRVEYSTVEWTDKDHLDKVNAFLEVACDILDVF